MSGAQPEEAAVEYVVQSRQSDLRRLGKTTGLCLIAYVLLQNAFVYGIYFLGLYDEYLNNATLYYSLVGIVSVLTLAVPFAIPLLGRKSPVKLHGAFFDMPQSKGIAVCAVLVGMAVCIVSNYATSYFIVFFEQFGIELATGTAPSSNDFLTRALMVVNTALAPAIIEEFVFRGVVLQPLRRYGEGFAIIASAVVSLAHASPVQIPFTFVVGVVLAYSVVVTESIWTGVALHFGNNLFAVVMNSFVNTESETGMKIYLATVTVIFVAGIAAAVVLGVLHRGSRLKRGTTALLFRERLSEYFFSPVMLVAIVILVVISFNYISLGGAA